MPVLGREFCGTRGRRFELCQEDRQTQHPLCSISPCSALCSSARLQCQTKYMCGEAAGAKAAPGEQHLPLVCSEVGWIDCAAVETQGQGTGVEGRTTGCCQRRKKREIFMFCGVSFPTLEKAFILCVCVNAL